MNRLFVVVLCRFSILVRVGPARRGATNKYLWRRGQPRKPRSVFCVPVFPMEGENDKDVMTPSFFRVRYDFLRRKNRLRVFGTNLFFGPSFSRGNENTLVKNEPKVS